MNILSFDYVKTIAKYGTISKAAEMLFISQPALSQSLNKLEKNLGVKLFIRQGNRMILTDAGAAFVEEGTSILQINERLKERLDFISSGKKEIVRLGLSRFYNKLPAILQDFVTNHPGVQFEITEGMTLDLETLFSKGELDLCIIPSSNFSSLHKHRTLFKEEILLVIPPNSSLNQYAIKNGDLPCYNLKYLKDSPFVSLTSNQRVYNLGIELCEKAGFKPQILCTVFGYDTLLMLVSMGLGVGFVSSLQKETLLRMPNPPKCYHILSDQPVTREYVLLINDNISNLASELADIIVALE